MKFASKLVIALSAAASVVGFASTASAEGQWGSRYHARHHEVYRGEHRQSDRYESDRYGHERWHGDFRGRPDFREDGRR